MVFRRIAFTLGFLGISTLCLPQLIEAASQFPETNMDTWFVLITVLGCLIFATLAATGAFDTPSSGQKGDDDISG